MIEKDFGVIGGGACGIGCGKYLSKLGHSFDIIEKNDDFGGLWYFDAKDSLVYKSTHLISSKLNTEFSDFPMPKEYPNYPDHKLFLQYLRNIAKHFNLYEHALFNSLVVSAKPVKDRWNVELQNGEIRSYKYLMICNGRLNKPVIPKIPGVFLGKSLHSKDYSDPEIFKDKSVLIIGSGNTGCDLAVDAVPFASKVFHSCRRGYHYMPKFIDGKPTQEWLMEIGNQFTSEEDLWAYVGKTFKLAGFNGEDFGLPKPDHKIQQAHPIMNSNILYHIGHGNIIYKPDVKMFDGNKVIFSDGTEENIDIIIYSTGYEFDFPFFNPDEVEVKPDLSNAFIYMFDKKYDNLFYGGYINAPAGLGNLANTTGNLMEAYLKAKEHDSEAYKNFMKIKLSPNPDLGQDRFIKTASNKFEVDLWQYIKTLNFLTSKLSKEDK